MSEMASENGLPEDGENEPVEMKIDPDKTVNPLCICKMTRPTVDPSS